ncbi:MAG: hypothetical protein Q8R16_03910 [bacterium]|nr:hypothetical protein [bacterium]
MATKYLARTIVEGGQCDEHAKRPRRAAQRSERARVRAYLRNCARDREWGDERICPVRESVSVCFADRTAALRRWMEQFVGRSWDEAYGATVRMCDRRTTKGRHLIEGHFRARDFVRPAFASKSILDGVAWFGETPDGIIESRPRPGWKRKREATITPAIAEWLAGRKVGQRGRTLFWFVPVGRWVTHEVADGTEAVAPTREYVVTGHRQDRRLSADEVAHFNAIDALTQTAILRDAP